jgi:hypothetical protein
MGPHRSRKSCSKEQGQHDLNSASERGLWRSRSRYHQMSRSVEFSNEDFNGDGEMHSYVWFVTTGIGEPQWSKGKH